MRIFTKFRAKCWLNDDQHLAWDLAKYHVGVNLVWSTETLYVVFLSVWIGGTLQIVSLSRYCITYNRKTQNDDVVHEIDWRIHNTGAGLISHACWKYQHCNFIFWTEVETFQQFSWTSEMGFPDCWLAIIIHRNCCLTLTFQNPPILILFYTHSWGLGLIWM